MNIVGKEKLTREVVKVAKSVKIVPEKIYDVEGESRADDFLGISLAPLVEVPKEPIIISIEDNSQRKMIACEKLVGANFAPALVHKSSKVKGEPGKGSIVMDMVTAPASTKIGAHCILGSGTIIGKNCSIADFVSIGENCRIGDNVQIGEGAELREGSMIASGTIVGAWSTILSHSFVNKEVEAMKKVSGIHGAL